MVIADWQKKRGRVIEDSISLTQKLKDIESEEQLINETLPRLTSIHAIRAQEQKLEELVLERMQIQEEKLRKDVEQSDVQTVINRCFYFLEHLEDTLLNGSDPIKNAVLFGAIFKTKPTYDELKYRTNTITNKMKSIFQLNEAYKLTGNLVVGEEGVEPTQPCD